MIISLNGIFCIVALTSFSMIPRLVGESVLGFRTCRLSAAWAVLVASRVGAGQLAPFPGPSPAVAALLGQGGMERDVGGRAAGHGRQTRRSAP